MGRSADVPRMQTTTRAGEVDDADCVILHVDMDAFFASVEVMRNPSLRGKPVIVGGGVRGVVAAASYEARVFGVRSAMSMSQALRLCPQAQVVPPTRGVYSEVSARVMSILRDVTPAVEALSLDEAFLDVRGAVRAQGSSVQIATDIRQRVQAELGLSCSVGVAATKFVAKVASARCKPNGLLVVPARDTLKFLYPLPVTVLWGVGARTAEPLRRLGVRSIEDLANTPQNTLERAIGAASAAHLSALARGEDPRAVSERESERSISTDHTYDTDLIRHDQVWHELLRLSAEVSSRVRARGLSAKTVGIKIRFADFTTITRVRTLSEWVDSTDAIAAAARDLFDRLDLDLPRIRLVGVKCENLRDTARVTHQLTLFPSAPPVVSPQTTNASRRDDARQPQAGIRDRITTASVPDAVLDAAVARFGPGAVTRASLL